MDVTHPTVLQTTQLFTPSVLLPTQVARPPTNRWLRRLYVAILSDALDCLEGKGPPSLAGSSRDGTHRQQEAWRWVMSETEHCVAFLTICAVLELNVEAIREVVRQRFARGRVPQPGFPRSLRQLRACPPEPSPYPEPRPEPENSGDLRE